MIVSSGEITIVDISDIKQLNFYIGATQSKTVIVNTKDGEYTGFIPDYTVNSQILIPQLYIAGTSTNIIDSAKSVSWYYQINSRGNKNTIGETTEWAMLDGNNLIINRNLLRPLHHTYSYRLICDVVYEDLDSGIDVPLSAEIELNSVTNGQDGSSSYLWVKYSKMPTGEDMTDNPDGATYIGVATTESPVPPILPTDYKWSLMKGKDGVRGEKGEDGQTTYLHIKYSNDGGKTFTGNNGEDLGDWIGTYVDFIRQDSNDVTKYKWHKVKGEPSVVAMMLTPEGNTIKNSEGTLKMDMMVYELDSEVTPVQYKWYKLDPTATIGNGADADGGNGWRRINDSFNQGIAGYTTRMIEIPSTAIDGLATFKCIAVYNHNKYQDIGTVMDITDPITVNIIGSDVFKNGQGESVFMARLYRDGKEIDIAGDKYVYAWSLYKSDGTALIDFGVKYGKSIVVQSNDFIETANLICEIRQKM